MINARPLKEGDGKGADRGVEGLLTGTERIDAPSQINPFALAAREIRRA